MLFLFTEIFYNMMLEEIAGWSKKSVALLYIDNKGAEKEIREKSTFTIATKT